MVYRHGEREEPLAALWTAAVAFYGVGDLLTTAVGLRYTPLVEVGPVALLVVEQFGLAAALALKLVLFAVFYALWTALPEPYDIGVPIGLAGLGAVITGWNALLLVLVA